jgi:hypothetical protein
MSEHDDRGLENEVRALLHAVREPPPTPSDVRARARARLMSALPPGPGGGDAGPAAPGRTPGAASSAATGPIARVLAARAPAWSLLVAFAAGAAAAVATLGPTRPAATPPSAAPSSAPPVVAAAPTSALPVAASTASAQDALTASGFAPLPPVAPSSPPANDTPPSTARAAPSHRVADGSLEEERAQLDVARTALGRGDGANALQAAEGHRRRFPRGAMSEEREAIEIQALRLLHRDDEASTRLGRFRERFPTSLMRPALEADDGGAR